MIRFQTSPRRREWFDEGLRLRPMLDPRSSACAGAMAGIYRRLLQRIERDPAAVLQRRVALPGWGEGAGSGAKSWRAGERRTGGGGRRRAGRHQRGPGAGGRGPASHAAGSARTPGRGPPTHFNETGLWLDNGQHVFLRCCTAYRAFIERIGSVDLVTMQRRLDIPVIHPERGVSRLARSDLPGTAAPEPQPCGVPASWPAGQAAGRALGGRAGEVGPGRPQPGPSDVWPDGCADRGVSSRSLESFWDLIVLPTLNLPSDEASLWQSAMVFQVGLLTDGPAADLRIRNRAARRSARCACNDGP